MTMASNRDGDTKTSSVQKPYNNYNVFYTLERVRLIDARRREGGERAPSSPSNGTQSLDATRTGYEYVELPELPPRYAHLTSVLPSNWYVPGKNKHTKRKHKASHGLISFKEIATIVSENWKSIDPATKQYTEAVGQIQKARYDELKKIEEMENVANGNWNSLSTANTDGPPQPKMADDPSKSQGSLEDMVLAGRDDFQEKSAQSSCNTVATTSMQSDYDAFLPPPPQSRHDEKRPWPEHARLYSYYDEMNPHRSSNMINGSRSTNQFTHGNQRSDVASSSQVHHGMHAQPIEPVSLDQIFSNHDDNMNMTRTVFDEVDVSDEEILDAYHSADCC